MQHNMSQRYKYLAVILLLPPMIGELLSASTPPLEFFNPIVMGILVGLYGTGALLIREDTIIWDKNWGCVLILGAAYGITEEGLAVKSFFDPHWMDLGILGVYGRWLGVKITYLEQKKKNIGTAFALSLAKKFLENDPFLVMYGDTLLQIDLKDFIDFHFSSKTLATIALTSIKEPTLYGVVKLRGEKIVDFIEKPKEEEVSRVISAGVFAFEPEIFNFLPPKPSANLEEKVFPTLAKRGMLSGYLFEGKWFDVGTQEAYEKVLKEWD